MALMSGFYTRLKPILHVKRSGRTTLCLLSNVNMRFPPLDVLKSWPTPNYIDPVTRGWENRIIIISLFPLVFLAISVRVFTRLRISRSFGLDDWLILAAIVCFLSFSSVLDVLMKLVSHHWIHDYLFARGSAISME